MKDLNIRREAIKILQEKAGKNLFDLGHRNFLLNTSPEARETKAKMNFWDLIKIKSFCTAKEAISKTKRQPTEWKKISANDISDKGLVSKIYKALIKLNTQETNNPVKKWAKDMKQIDTSPKKISRLPTDTWKNAQNNSSLGKYKSNPQWDTTLHLSEWLTLTTQATDVSEDVEREDLFGIAGGNANWCSHSGKQYGGSSKN